MELRDGARAVMWEPQKWDGILKNKPTVVEPEGESRSDHSFLSLGGNASPSLYMHRRNTPHLILEGDAHKFLNQEAEVSHHSIRRARESSPDNL